MESGQQFFEDLSILLKGVPADYDFNMQNAVNYLYRCDQLYHVICKT